MRTLRALSVSAVLMIGAVPILLQAQQSQSVSQPDAQQPPPSAQPPASQPPAGQAPATQPPTSAPSAGSSSSSSSAPAKYSERRITGGFIGSFVGFPQIPDKSSTVNNSSVVTSDYQTTGATNRFGYGLTLQARITNHFYVDVSGLLRHLGYQLTTTVATTTTSVLNGTTFQTTTVTSTHEDTRARLIDIPLLVRFYGSPKRPRSPRWFVELGGAWRTANNIRTSIDATDAVGNVTCCTTTPTVPQHRSTFGGVVGAGIQFVDELGIHVVPEFRYTHWSSATFENLTTNGRLNQIEADLSITF
ncbi:MAG TPA: hypothetical protein VFW44_00650 [Bryobacteraceae bacterium]|nr:hypothetical protein [Bryobacteraceae bacterium]